MNDAIQESETSSIVSIVSPLTDVVFSRVRLVDLEPRAAPIKTSTSARPPTHHGVMYKFERLGDSSCSFKARFLLIDHSIGRGDCLIRAVFFCARWESFTSHHRSSVRIRSW